MCYAITIYPLLTQLCPLILGSQRTNPIPFTNSFHFIIPYSIRQNSRHEGWLTSLTTDSKPAAKGQFPKATTLSSVNRFAHKVLALLKTWCARGHRRRKWLKFRMPEVRKGDHLGRNGAGSSPRHPSPESSHSPTLVRQPIQRQPGTPKPRFYAPIVVSERLDSLGNIET